ncbi:hypothetical protein BDZ97DRAFT_1914501 [Flammula alnicola]|nr:hypothetical protein BDZ97DRAFT_1914501 [Flammula alnicola]
MRCPRWRGLGSLIGKTEITISVFVLFAPAFHFFSKRILVDNHIQPMSRPKPRLFALIIGINSYREKCISPLKYAVADALAMANYLQTHLKVPPNQIEMLLNERASRDSILNALKRLEEDRRIGYDDPIFIFFAGHGTECRPPPGWESGGVRSKIQMLVPYDWCPEDSTLGKKVLCIPDRTIGAFLEGIANKKGNNILYLIAVMRHPGREGIPTKWPVGPISNDRPVRGNMFYGGLESHVLIAACGRGERAYESGGHGHFTAAFLELLEREGRDNLIYSEIPRHMKVHVRQNPQCEGINQNRRLFSTEIPPPQPTHYITRFEEIGNDGQCAYTLNAGSAHDLTAGAEFAVYPSRNAISGKPLGRLQVDQLKTFSAIMKVPEGDFPFPVTMDAVAIQTKASSRKCFRLYIRSDDRFNGRPLLCSLRNVAKDEFQKIVMVNNAEDAHLNIAIENNTATVRVIDKRVTKYGLIRKIDAGVTTVAQVAQLLNRATNYYGQLNRTNNISHNCIRKSVTVECYKLEGLPSKFPDVEQAELSPVGDNLCVDGVIDFVPQENSFYGIKLINRSDYDLFPRVLYFDNSDLSMKAFYEPPSSGKYDLDVPLKKAGGTLTIGYGSGGWPPLSSRLRDGHDIQVDFIKLFLYTEPLTSVKRSTIPFRLQPTTTEHWDTGLVTVIQRRRPSPRPQKTQSILPIRNPPESSERRELSKSNEISACTSSSEPIPQSFRPPLRKRHRRRQVASPGRRLV